MSSPPSERVETDALIAALTRIQALSEDDRQVVAADAAAKLAALRDEVERLSAQVRYLVGKPYRPSRESVPPGQLAFELIEMLTAHRDGTGASGKDGGKGEDGQGAEPAAKPARAPRKRRGRELARQIVENRLADHERACPDCGKAQAEIGFDAQERFVYEPAKVFILEERCYKYACAKGCGGVERAAPTLPPKLIAGSMASASLLAYLIVSKLLDGLPIERIAKQLRRHGVDLATSTLHDWIGRAADLLAFMPRVFRDELRACALVSLDDTPMPAQSRGHPSGMQRGRLWIYLGDLDRVAYTEYTPDWKGVHPRRVLDGFAGHIQNDGYAGINPLFVGDGAPRRVGCNDHARRKFVQALEQRDTRAQPVVDLYRALYRVEAEAREAGMDAERRRAYRQAHALPLWQRLAETIDRLAPNAGHKSPLGKAVTYWQRQNPSLRAYLDDGTLPISNAHVERQIRTVALFRKNSLFYGSPEAGERHAVLLAVLLNCVLAGANPYDYLVWLFDRVADDWPQSRVLELTPRAWLEARKREHQLHAEADLAG